MTGLYESTPPGRHFLVGGPGQLDHFIPEGQFPHLSDGDNNSTYFTVKKIKYINANKTHRYMSGTY